MCTASPRSLEYVSDDAASLFTGAHISGGGGVHHQIAIGVGLRLRHVLLKSVDRLPWHVTKHLTLHADEHEVVEEENYFVSMTDMMVGLVFIFIILLMDFALDFRDVTAELSGADRTDAQILHEMQESLREKGVQVSRDTQNGVLRLPDSILFDSARS